MYLARKVDKILENRIKDPLHNPLLVAGIRQCGKTESIRHFGKTHFKYVNEINFWQRPEASHIFDGSLEIESLIKAILLEFPSFKFVPGETLLFLDEIQECPRARLALKSFKDDGRFEVIASGSYLGVNIDHPRAEPTPKPEGAEEVLQMFTLDFEEFLWAKGYTPSALSLLEECFLRRTPIPTSVHETLLSIYNEYLCVGGFPESVLRFVQSGSFKNAHDKNKSLVFDIKGDPSKRKDAKGNALYAPSEVARIQKAFDLIPSFTLSDNKRFVASRIEGNGPQRVDAVNYLVNAGVAFKANNVTVPALPLSIGKIENDYKLLYADIGLLTASFSYDEIKATIRDQLGVNKGYLYEAAVGETLRKIGITPYYFGKPSKLEIDYVISYKGKATLIEAKSKTGNTKAAKIVMNDPAHYGKTKLIKIGSYNIEESGDILTLPCYLTFLLGREQDDISPIIVNAE
ncbi:MAG: ATP-binding protein [Bacilli bacterium]|nr:ATP-binding protein [Bacilli bacterium]